MSYKSGTNHYEGTHNAISEQNDSEILNEWKMSHALFDIDITNIISADINYINAHII